MDLVTLAAACALYTKGLAPFPCHNGVTPDTTVRSMPTSAADLDHLPNQWDQFIGEAAHRFDVPTAWIRRVMTVESGGRIMLRGRPITSSAGAMGLMQLMPQTYGDMRRAFDLGSDPFDPHDNILAGAAYLRAMYDRFGSGVFAAYNAGPQRYQDYLDGKRRLPAETVAYDAKLHLPPSAIIALPTENACMAEQGGLFVRLTAQRSDSRNPPVAPTVAATNSASLFAVNAQGSLPSSPSQQKYLFIALSRPDR